jgi:hypothetical protein
MPLAGLAGSDQYAQFTKEQTASWGTYHSAATVKPWVELENGALDIDRKPIVKSDRIAPGNVPGREVASRYEVMGTYKTKLFPELMIPFIPWACTPVVTGGRLQLPSFTVDWFDGVEPRRFRGCRVEEATFEYAADAQWGYATFKFRGRDEDGTPPTITSPAGSSYPQVDPSVLVDTTGLCEFGVGGGVITGYRAFKINVKNILDAQFDEFPVLNSLDYCGRTVSADFVIKNTGTARKLLYQNQTATSAIFKWAKLVSGPLTYTTIFDLQDTNYIGNRTVDRGFDKSQYETLSFQAFYDRTASTDFVATSASA